MAIAAGRLKAHLWRPHAVESQGIIALDQRGVVLPKLLTRMKDLLLIFCRKRNPGETTLEEMKSGELSRSRKSPSLENVGGEAHGGPEGAVENRRTHSLQEETVPGKSPAGETEGLPKCAVEKRRTQLRCEKRVRGNSYASESLGIVKPDKRRGRPAEVACLDEKPVADILTHKEPREENIRADERTGRERKKVAELTRGRKEGHEGRPVFYEKTVYLAGTDDARIEECRPGGRLNREDRQPHLVPDIIEPAHHFIAADQKLPRSRRQKN